MAVELLEPYEFAAWTALPTLGACDLIGKTSERFKQAALQGNRYLVLGNVSLIGGLLGLFDPLLREEFHRCEPMVQSSISTRATEMGCAAER